MLNFEKVYYAAYAPPPSTPTIHVNERFFNFPDVDYAFIAPPQSLQVDGSQTVTKTSLQLVPWKPIQK